MGRYKNSALNHWIELLEWTGIFWFLILGQVTLTFKQLWQNKCVEESVMPNLQVPNKVLTNKQQSSGPVQYLYLLLILSK